MGEASRAQRGLRRPRVPEHAKTLARAQRESARAVLGNVIGNDRALPSRARSSYAQSARHRARQQTSDKSSPMAASLPAAGATSSLPYDIKDAVQDLAHRPLARPARRAGLRQARRDHAPLHTGPIGLVSLDGAAMLLSSGRRPHSEIPVGSRNPWNRSDL
jgi:hypothetical protein